MIIDEGDTYRAFLEAVAACEPGARVADMLAQPYPRQLHAAPGPHPELRAVRDRIGVAVGKAAVAMARGAGPVARGLAVTIDPASTSDPRDVPAPPAALPAGWRFVHAGHPDPDDRSIAAAAEVRALVEGATDEDLVLALISGGASALIEEPRIALAELQMMMRTLSAAGVAIHELNAVRCALSTIKGGQLAEACGARMWTLVTSDVIGDPLDVIGSGPTIGPWLGTPGLPADAGAAAEVRRQLAIDVLARHRIAVPGVLTTPVASRIVTRHDRAELVVGMRAFADAARQALADHGVYARRLDPPFAGDVDAVATLLASRTGPFVAWGEATVRIPDDHGDGGRAQQLALALAKRFAGQPRSALVIGSDGIDGPHLRDRATPAGAYVDGDTWGALRVAGVDPDEALARCDAGNALALIGALVVTGPTGVNHADIAIVG